jgi:Zn-dependent M28 family amino/carboxypeptidase
MRNKRPLITFGIALGILLLGSGAGCAFITQPLVDPLASPPAQVDTVALENHVRMLAVTLHPRSIDNAANLDAAADYVIEQMRATGARTAVQSFEANGTTYRNLIARFGPDEGALLVIGAHYDSCGDTPGADDNASGVAGLLELARLLAASPPPHPVELVAYTLEEPPFFRTENMGSFQHARELARGKREVRLMMSLETIGYFRDDSDTQRFPVGGLGAFYPDQGNFIAIVGRFGDFGETRRVKALFRGATDLPAESINAPRSVPGVDFSDHASYWQFGYPAVMVTDTAFLRNPNYHGAGDTPATLDYRRMAQVVQATYAVATLF